jgi:hypothetical protein
MTHILLKNPRLRGWEYGMLRALEDEIVRKTNATILEVPDYGSKFLKKRGGHNMRFDAARQVFPKKPLRVEADVIWYILMGPENYELDLFTGWELNAKHRIVYLFDTLEPQFILTKKLFSNNLFNIKITSFNDAELALEKLTGHKWQTIEQAVPATLFSSVPLTEKLIHFSSYGRRLPEFHNALLEFCSLNNLYYDYTTHNGQNPAAPEEELYKQYAWHLNHSLFNVSWPVEITNPARAGKLNPITCRWFEAVAAGTIILGKKPNNTLFDNMLHPDLVIEVDPNSNKEQLFRKLDEIVATKEQYYEQAKSIAEKILPKITWGNRVERILENLLLESAV